ncbi:hypothetical protein SLA2020_148140 [Shorea laevis]
MDLEPSQSLSPASLSHIPISIPISPDPPDTTPPSNNIDHEHPTILYPHPPMGNFLSLKWGIDDTKPGSNSNDTRVVSTTAAVVGAENLCCMEEPTSSEQALLPEASPTLSITTNQRSAISKRSVQDTGTHVYRKQHRTRGDRHPYYANEAHCPALRSTYPLNPIQGPNGEHSSALSMVSYNGGEGPPSVPNSTPSVSLPESNHAPKVTGPIISSPSATHGQEVATANESP